MGAKLQGRSRGGGRRSRALMSDITAPLLTAGVDINLPKAEAKAISQNDNAPLEVSIDTKGNTFVGDKPVEVAQMKAMLSSIAIQAPDRRVYIRADKGLDYGRVMQVMAAVSQSGFTKIALITDSKNN